MKNQLIKYCLLFVLVLGGIINAQNLESSVDKTTVGQYERFQLYFTFKCDDVNSVRNFRAPSIDGLRILGGPNQSSSMQIINGSVTASITFTYVLQSVNVGNFDIGSASVSFKGKTYSSKPIKIKVVKGKPKSGDKNNNGVSQEELEKSVFIVAKANKKNLYKGEEVVVEYKLYTKLNISNPSIQSLPKYQGFWAEDLEMPQNLNFQIEMYKGQRYRATTIKKVALFPSRSGKLEITPFELKVPVLVKTKRKRSNDVFDDFFNDSFFGRTETIEFVAKSNPIKLNVKNLPTNAPKSFNGVVGNFNFAATVDKESVKANEAVTFKFTISGRGNINLIQPPKLELPAGFEVYDPKSSEKVDKKGRISGSKSVEYIVVPRVPGKKEIGKVEFSYFDPAKAKYIRKSSKNFIINVEPSETQYTASSTSGYSKSDIELLNEDIRFINTTIPVFTKIKSGDLIKSWFWFMLVFPTFALIVIIGVKKRRDKLSGNIVLMKYKKADKAARNRLKSAKKELDSRNKLEFYSELSLALTGYLEDKLGIQKSEYTIDKAIEELMKVSVSNELIEKVKSISGKCEFARFAPKVEGMEAEAEIYKSTVKLIISLDQEISKGGRK